MKYVGAHTSSSGGVYNAISNATDIGARAFALFVKNQRQWFAKPLEQDVIDKFKQMLKDAKIDPKHVLPHDSYLINLGHEDDEKREKSIKSFLDEIDRCNQLGLVKLNFHPGSHLEKFSKKDPDLKSKIEYAELNCIDRIATSLNTIIKESDNVKLVIENTAGQGTNVGYKFDHLSEIIARVEQKDRMGVCIDTCHMFAAGYDIRDEKSFTKTWDLFDKSVGFEYLEGMHINDSKSTYESRVDRHHSLGIGNIGIESFKLLMKDDRFDDIPLILETINSDIWKEEIELLYSFT